MSVRLKFKIEGSMERNLYKAWKEMTLAAGPACQFVSIFLSLTLILVILACLMS